MQIINQIARQDTVAKTPYPTRRYPLNAVQPSLYLSNLNKASPETKSPRFFLDHNLNADKVSIGNKQEEREQSHILLERNGYTIRLIKSLKQRIQASTLIRHRYASRGYCTEGATDFFYNPGQVSFEASIGECVIGTLTICHDTENGLQADALYKEELKALRIKNRKIYELSKLAINPQYSSKELLASLFNLAYIHARIVHKATDFVIEVNPRHVSYYKRLLGFHQIGELRICRRVKAPAVLLHLELDYVDAQVASLAGSHDSRQRSLYTSFLTKYEEEKVTNKIQRKLTEQQLYDRLQAQFSHFM